MHADHSHTRACKFELLHVACLSCCPSVVHLVFSLSYPLFLYSYTHSLSSLSLPPCQPGDVGVSLGTSDTLFAVVASAQARPSGSEGVVLPGPTDNARSAMLMLCFKNGSVTREKVGGEEKGRKKKSEQASLRQPA